MRQIQASRVIHCLPAHASPSSSTRPENSRDDQARLAPISPKRMKTRKIVISLKRRPGLRGEWYRPGPGIVAVRRPPWDRSHAVRFLAVESAGGLHAELGYSPRLTVSGKKCVACPGLRSCRRPDRSVVCRPGWWRSAGRRIAGDGVRCSVSARSPGSVRSPAITSLTPSRPPCLSTRNASASTRGSSADRLTTQLEMMASTWWLVGQGDVLDATMQEDGACDDCWRRRGRACRCWRPGRRRMLAGLGSAG